MIVGGLALSGDATAARAAATGNVWILYPFAPPPAHRWVPFAWVALGSSVRPCSWGSRRGRRGG